jgi:hypothetical protein
MSAITPATISRVSAAISVEIGGFDPILQHPAQPERKRRGATADDKATKTPRIQGGGEQRGPGANVGSNHMRALQPEYVGEANHELAHCLWREQLIATLGVAETGQVDRHQMRVLGEAVPSRLEGEQALGPRT